MSRLLAFFLIATLGSASIAAAADLPANPLPLRPAAQADNSAGTSTDDSGDAADDTSKVDLDSGADVTSFAGASVYLRGTISPEGDLDQSGVRLRVGAEGDIYSYPGPRNAPIRDNEAQGDALAGYEWVSSNLSVVALIGANVQDHMLTAYDPENPVRGERAGVKGMLEITDNPTDDIQLAGYGSLASAFDTYEIDLRPGLRVADEVYFGPQLAFYGDEQYSEWRIGPQLTGVKIGPVETFIAAGFLHDSLQGNGAYTTLEADTRF